MIDFALKLSRHVAKFFESCRFENAFIADFFQLWYKKDVSMASLGRTRRAAPNPIRVIRDDYNCRG